MQGQCDDDIFVDGLAFLLVVALCRNDYIRGLCFDLNAPRVPKRCGRVSNLVLFDKHTLRTAMMSPLSEARADPAANRLTAKALITLFIGCPP